MWLRVTHRLRSLSSCRKTENTHRRLEWGHSTHYRSLANARMCSGCSFKQCEMTTRGDGPVLTLASLWKSLDIRKRAYTPSAPGAFVRNQIWQVEVLRSTIHLRFLNPKQNLT